MRAMTSRRPIFALAVLLLAGGCASLVSERIVTPPKVTTLAMDRPAFEAFTGITRNAWQGPGDLRLAWRDVPAARRAFSSQFARDDVGAGFSIDIKQAPEPIAARGTVVYLHGWGLDGNSMLPWALALSEQGWHGVAIDLRHHGESSPAPVGYGPREAADVAALLGALRAQGRLQEPVFLFGSSYGATAALFAEPLLAGQVRGIVALAPFANAADAVRTVLAVSARGGGPEAWVAGAQSSLDVEEAIRTASARLGVDLRAIDLHPVVAASHTCALILHGANDKLLAPDASRALAAASPLAQFTPVPGHNHLDLPMRMDWLAAPLDAWLRSVGTGASCPPLTLPAEPATTSP